MNDPICFDCKHFRQYQPLEFTIPGECGWTYDPVPTWLELYLSSYGDRYYGPKRDVYSARGGNPTIQKCAAFQKKDVSP